MLYFYLISYFIYVLIRTRKNLKILQQNFYNNSNRYIKWIFKNSNKSFLLFDWLFLITIAFIMFFDLDFNLYLGILYTLLWIFYLSKYLKEQNKLKFKFTARVKRLTLTFVIIYTLFTFIFFKINNPWNYIMFGCLASFNVFILYIINIINKPIEKVVYIYYFKKAEKKLKDYKSMKVIGITGSYGKTSSKNILNDILKIKYDTLPSPQNYNTPYGLMLTINNYLDKFNEYFIAEMGACEAGQIKELCDFVKPKYGIITKIGVAHLDSFKTEKNIIDTKFELIESLPNDGIGILNMDDLKQVNHKIKNKCNIYWVSIDNHLADLYATDIKYSSSGVVFNAVFKNDKGKYQFESKLLGKANVYNILSGIMLGKKLGMTIEELQRGVKGILPIEHRLKVKRMNDMTIIDDAYNSNPEGTKNALETLSLMPGKKVVVTPGMIELKDKEYQLNYEFGIDISKVADVVILVGKKQTKAIFDALKEVKFKEKNIYIIDDVKLSFAIIRKLNDKNVYVLLENDLPDIFNE